MDIYARFVKNMRRFCILLRLIVRIEFELCALKQQNSILFSTLLYIMALRVGALYLCKKSGSREGKYSAEMKMNKTEKYVNDSFS